MIVYGLFITPHFTPAMERGIEPAPYVNHDEIDWASLGQSLSEYFEIPNQGVTLRMADDTVDQVTIHLRQISARPDSIDCKDFGNALLQVAAKTRSNPVPAQEAWHTLHHLKDRSKAPPPVMIPLILEGEITDIAELTYNMLFRLGVKAARHPEKMLSSEKLPPDFHEGRFPKAITDLLEHHFGVGYKPYALLTRLSSF